MTYGILRTADATPPVAASTVVVSLILFVLVYFVVFSIGILYICKMLGKGPKQIAPRQESMPNRPLSAGQATNGTVGLFLQVFAGLVISNAPCWCSGCSGTSCNRERDITND